jgi:MFS family permease
MVIRLGILLTSLAPAFAFLVHLSGSPWLGQLYPLVFVALGISQGTYIIGFSNYVIEVAPEPLRPAYIGLGNSVSGLSSIWPLVGGWLLTTASYSLLFGLTAALTLLAFAFSLRLQRTASRQQEPLESRQRP